MAPEPASRRRIVPASRWIPLSYPERFKMRPAELAEFCGWRTRMRDGSLEVCLTEVYRQRPTSLLRLTHLATPPTAGKPRVYRHVDRWRSKEPLTQDDRPQIDEELRRLVKLQTREAFWAAFRLDIIATPDPELASRLQHWYERMAEEGPESSLWAIDIDPWYYTRQSLVRGLFAASEVPELLERPAEEFGGLPAARGLQGSGAGLGITPTVEIALAATAPWMLGITVDRVGVGMVVVLFGHPEPGRGDPVATELLLHSRPRLLSSIEPDIHSRPDTAPAQIQEVLRWWIGRLNALFGVVLDPANYPDEHGAYNAPAHFGALLSLDRLLACVLGVLVHARRDEFVRKLLLFDCLDLLEGFHQGSYEQLCNPRSVGEQLNELATTLPTPVAELLLPRCRSALAALEQLEDGFYVHERVSPSGLEIRNRRGEAQTVSLPDAVARYLRVVRNATHAFRQMTQHRPDQISLLAAHDGELPPDLSDLAFLHLVRVLADPASLLPGALVQQRYSVRP